MRPAHEAVADVQSLYAWDVETRMRVCGRAMARLDESSGHKTDSVVALASQVALMPNGLGAHSHQESIETSDHVSAKLRQAGSE